MRLLTTTPGNVIRIISINPSQCYNKYDEGEGTDSSAAPFSLTPPSSRFSGIGEEDVEGHHASLSEVQETLLSFINADTILIGHSLETDLCLLKVTFSFFL